MLFWGGEKSGCFWECILLGKELVDIVNVVVGWKVEMVVEEGCDGVISLVVGELVVVV